VDLILHQGFFSSSASVKVCSAKQQNHVNIEIFTVRAAFVLTALPCFASVNHSQTVSKPLKIFRSIWGRQHWKKFSKTLSQTFLVKADV